MPRKERRQIGGTIWQADVKLIKENVDTINGAAQAILKIVKGAPAMPARAAILVYLTTITSQLTGILSALDRLIKTAEIARDEHRRVESDPWNEIVEETE